MNNFNFSHSGKFDFTYVCDIRQNAVKPNVRKNGLHSSFMENLNFYSRN